MADSAGVALALRNIPLSPLLAFTGRSVAVPDPGPEESFANFAPDRCRIAISGRPEASANFAPGNIVGRTVVDVEMPSLISIHHPSSASGKQFPHLLHQSAGVAIRSRKIFKLEFLPKRTPHRQTIGSGRNSAASDRTSVNASFSSVDPRKFQKPTCKANSGGIR